MGSQPADHDQVDESARTAARQSTEIDTQGIPTPYSIYMDEVRRRLRVVW